MAKKAACDSRDLYLSSDERYQVWLVKTTERPELLEVCHKIAKGAAEQKDADLPLTDGCDLPGWRRAGFVDCSDSVLSVLNVGQGCSLLRRERQLPVLCNKNLEQWEDLREFLFEPPSNTATRIKYEPNMTINPWFEQQNIPVILDGCTDNWKAMQSCRFQELVRRYGDYEWRFSDNHGETTTLRTYQKYLTSLEGLTDDAPLAVYDSQFGYDERADLLDDYQVPSCFDTDLFELLGNQDENRPPYRWILIGPARSGTGLHIDPVGTHAWVTLVEGCKRWVLFPAGTRPESIHMQDPQIPSAIWFRDYYDQAMREHPGAIEVLQRPGETVYVPAGWPHLVLNLELSVAITHNYATEYPMDRLWKAVVDAEPEFAVRFHQALKMHRPELVARMEEPGL